jgi:hypothetical protein
MAMMIMVPSDRPLLARLCRGGSVWLCVDLVYKAVMAKRRVRFRPAWSP